MKDPIRWRWLPLLGITLLAALFGFLNAGEAVAVHFGAFILYQVPLVVLIFFAFLLGMFAMFLVGLRQDMKVRQLLRDRRMEAPAPRSVTHYAPPDPDP